MALMVLAVWLSCGARGIVLRGWGGVCSGGGMMMVWPWRVERSAVRLVGVGWFWRLRAAHSPPSGGKNSAAWIFGHLLSFLSICTARFIGVGSRVWDDWTVTFPALSWFPTATQPRINGNSNHVMSRQCLHLAVVLGGYMQTLFAHLSMPACLDAGLNPSPI